MLNVVRLSRPLKRTEQTTAMLLLQESSACSLNTHLQARAPIHLSVSVCLHLASFGIAFGKLGDETNELFCSSWVAKPTRYLRHILPVMNRNYRVFIIQTWPRKGGGGCWELFHAGLTQFYTQWTVKCNVFRPVSLVSFFIFVLLHRFLWLFFCSVRIFFFSIPFSFV
jgi:hypothetical protein